MSAPLREVFLVRHAEAIYDASIADSERPLSARGLSQADELVRHLEPLGIEEIYTSPFQRCRHTIAPLSNRLGCDAVVVEDFRERAFTQDHIPDWASVWRQAWMDVDFAFGDGESGREAQRRILDAMHDVVCRSRAATLAVSSHGNVIALLLAWLDSDFGFEHACAIRNPDVFRLTFDGERLQWDPSFDARGLEAFATVFGA